MNQLHLIANAKSELVHLTEEIGALATHLREAEDDSHHRNHPGARMSLQDAVEILGSMETRCADLAAVIARKLEGGIA